MAQFDRSADIPLALNVVWAEVERSTQSEIVEGKKFRQLLITRFQNASHIYYLESRSETATTIRYVVSNAPNVKTTLFAAPDVARALDELPGDDLSPQAAQAAENRLQQITHNAETSTHPELAPTSSQASTDVAPLHPLIVLIAATLFSPLFGGILTALNWRRMGKAMWFWPTILIGCFLMGLVGAISTLTDWLLPWGPWLRLHGTTQFAVNLVIGVLLALWQTPSYRQWWLTHEDHWPTISPVGCGVYLVALIISFFLGHQTVATLSPVLTPVVVSLRPIQTFQGLGVAFSYPAVWIAEDETDWPASLKAECEAQRAHCMFVAFRASQDIYLIAADYSGRQYTVPSIEQLDEDAWQGAEQRGMRLVSRQTLLLDDHPAVQRNFTTPSGRFAENVLAKESDGSLLEIEISADNSKAFNLYQNEIDSILSSLRFVSAPQA